MDKRKSAQDFETIVPMWSTKYNGFDCGIRYNGSLVGMIGLPYIDWGNSETSIGYFLSEQDQGKGIVTRSVRALRDYLFKEMNINRIVIQVAENNLRSIAIPSRLGFTQEGIKRDGQWLYDHYENLLVFSMLKREWENSH